MVPTRADRCCYDFFGTGGNEMGQRVLTRLRMMWPLHDKEFAGHKNPKTDRTLKSIKTRPLMSWRRSQWNETRRMTSIAFPQYIQQCKCCHTSFRCASMAAHGDVMSLNELARHIKSHPMKLQYWPLAGPLRILGFPDASCRNNDDNSSQRGVTVFLAEWRGRSSRDGMTFMEV